MEGLGSIFVKHYLCVTYYKHWVRIDLLLHGLIVTV